MSSTSRILGSRTTTLHSHWRSKTASIQTERDLTEAKWKTIPDQIISTPDSYPFTHRPLCTLRIVTLNSEWNRMNGLEETIIILKEVLFIILQCNVVVFFFGLPALHYKYNNTGVLHSAWQAIDLDFGHSLSSTYALNWCAIRYYIVVGAAAARAIPGSIFKARLFINLCECFSSFVLSRQCEWTKEVCVDDSGCVTPPVKLSIGTRTPWAEIL